MTEFNMQKVSWRKRIIRYAPLLIWIGVIFFLSSGQASMSNTSLFMRPFLEWLFPNASEETLLNYLVFIRKAAHPSVYAVLGFLAARAFSTSAKIILQRYWFLFSLLLVFLIASTDEFNQSFLASRTGAFSDVMLDTAGGLTALTFYFLYLAYFKGETSEPVSNVAEI